MTVKINTDGGSRANPGQAACAFVAKDDTGNLLEKRGKYLGIATNNVAEYQGVVEALKWMKEGGVDGRQTREVEFYLDSKLVVNQLNGEFKIKDENLKKLYLEAKELEQGSGLTISYTYVPREENSEADLLVNQTLDNFTS